MHIELVTRGFDIPDLARDSLEGRIAELGQLGLGITEAAVSMVQNRHQYTAEITLFGRRTSFHAETNVEADSVSQAMDMILGKAEKQIRRHKERMRGSRRKPRLQEPLSEVAAGAEHDVQPGVVAHVGTQSSIETEGRGHQRLEVTIVPEPALFENKPMSVEEASLQLDMGDDPLLVFRNAETREVNVVLKREDGAIGWVHP